MNRSRRRTPRAGARSGGRRILDLALATAILLMLIVVSLRLDRMAEITRSGTAVVNDGDSITLDGERVRLKGIDAPELAQTCGRSGGTYFCGREARDSLRTLTNGGGVSCTGDERDRYGRLLATCRAGGRNLNQAQVEAGWAVAYGGYVTEEAKARARGAGLWAGTFEKPRDWRDMRGSAGEIEAGILHRLWMRVAELFARGRPIPIEGDHTSDTGEPGGVE